MNKNIKLILGIAGVAAGVAGCIFANKAATKAVLETVKDNIEDNDDVEAVKEVTGATVASGGIAGLAIAAALILGELAIKDAKKLKDAHNEETWSIARKGYILTACSVMAIVLFGASTIETMAKGADVQ